MCLHGNCRILKSRQVQIYKEISNSSSPFIESLLRTEYSTSSFVIERTIQTPGCMLYTSFWFMHVVPMIFLIRCCHCRGFILPIFNSFRKHEKLISRSTTSTRRYTSPSSRRPGRPLIYVYFNLR